MIEDLRTKVKVEEVADLLRIPPQRKTLITTHKLTEYRVVGKNMENSNGHTERAGPFYLRVRSGSLQGWNLYANHAQHCLAAAEYGKATNNSNVRRWWWLDQASGFLTLANGRKVILWEDGYLYASADPHSEGLILRFDEDTGVLALAADGRQLYIDRQGWVRAANPGDDENTDPTRREWVCSDLPAGEREEAEEIATREREEARKKAQQEQEVRERRQRYREEAARKMPACLGEAGRLVFVLALDDGSSKLPPQVSTECCICLAEDKDTVFIPCGHVCCCEGCAKQIQGSSDHRCPICRENVAQAVKCSLA